MQPGNTSVEFPVPFTSADSYSMGDIGEHSYGEYTYISDLTNEGFIAHYQTPSKPFRWFAIGI